MRLTKYSNLVSNMCQAQGQSLNVWDWLTDLFTLSHKYTYELHLNNKETFAQRIKLPTQDHSAEILAKAAKARAHTLNY